MTRCEDQWAGAVSMAVGSLATVILAATITQCREDQPVPSNHDFRAAFGAMQQRRYEEAAGLFEPIAKGRGGNASLALGWLAECRYYLKDDAAALAACDRLAKLAPGDGRANYVRALVLLRDGQQETAREQLKLATERGEELAATVKTKGSE